MKDELEEEEELEDGRTSDLSLNVFEFSSGDIGAAMAQVTTARRQKRSFILLTDWNLRESKDFVRGARSGARIWR